MRWFSIVLRRGLAIAIAGAALAIGAQAATYYYTGPFGGEFFDEANWNSLPGGGGMTPTAGTLEPSLGFTDEFIIDGDSVTATGPSGFVLDIGAGGVLSLLSGSELQVTIGSFNSQLEVSTGGILNIVDATLGVDDDIFIRGTLNTNGGSVESFADDVEFISSDVTIVGTTFTFDDSTIFRAELTPAAGASISGATFNSASRIGIREFNVTVTDSHFNVTGDVEDVFSTDLDTATAALTLLGESTLIADQVQEGVRLRIGGSSVVTLVNQPDEDEATWVSQSSTLTLDSPNAQLVLLTNQNESAAGAVINGVTGVPYAADSSTWTPTNWNGSSAVTLQITSTPVDADFSGDGPVDGTDFLIWQRGLGLTGLSDNSDGDANGDGVVDGADLAAWNLQYGAAAAAPSVSAVPEPACATLGLSLAFGCAAARRRRVCPR